MFVVIVRLSRTSSNVHSILGSWPSFSACLFIYYRFQSYHWPPLTALTNCVRFCSASRYSCRPPRPWQCTYNDYFAFHILFYGLHFAFQLLKWVTLLSSSSYWDHVAIQLWPGPTCLLWSIQPYAFFSNTAWYYCGVVHQLVSRCHPRWWSRTTPHLEPLFPILIRAIH